ncbi:hypothetical protein Xcel_1377 [Xylanimonas cellulosilytica DSM 15894]|uniref:Uncharacterized protein n=1 Tax=Xylanimonas cellulosilytica (strain DSM 15894 / JCM 12276 / CECT 5975 / KCTC 9989 / LMG 20990 / NBRC 107835 / XIL07) TaxID=446471 RepID=D1BRF3_XYLCX|nr:hypothetical protein [Xylanimonas cellulosilytica]ACZ30408.1 hypothetical protein Xcel_1377 [Xylanimonas cellulosilytica DSM 15894]
MVLTDLTVFVVGDDERGKALREAFAQWAAEDVVVPTAWVTPSSAVVAQHGPPEVSARVVTKDGERTEDLFRFIGKYRLDTVRVVVGQFIALDDRTPDADLLVAAQAIASAIDDALPRAHREGGHTTHLWRLNLVAPVSGVADVPQSALIPSWNVNAIVSAEDRPDADHANTFVRYPGNALGHMAAAMAAVSGVFAGVDTGVFEALGADQSTSNGREVNVVRVAVRAVIGDDAETRLAVRTLEAVAAEPTGASAFVEWGRIAVKPDQVVADIDAYLRSREPWVSGRPDRPRQPVQKREGLRSAADEALAFNRRMFSVVPKWLLLRGRSKLEDVATNAIIGEGADAVVRFNPASPEAMQHSAERYLKQVDESAQKAELTRAAESVAMPDARAWAGLRSLLFAAVDGGELPNEIETPRFAGMREVLAPACVVPDPADVFEARGRVLNPVDPAAARALGAELFAAVHERLAVKEATEAELATAASALVAAEEADAASRAGLEGAQAAEEALQAEAKATPAAKAAGKKKSAHGGETTLTEVPEPRPIADRLKDAVAARVQAAAAAGKTDAALRKATTAHESADATATEAAAAFAEAEAAHQEFREWERRVGGSVLFKLVDDVVARRDDFRQRFATSRGGLVLSAPPNDDLERAQRSLVSAWRVTFAAWTLVGVVTALTWFLVWQGLLEAWEPAVAIHDNWYWIMLGATFAVPIALALANHAYYRANRRFVWRVQVLAADRLKTSEDVVFFGREAARLDQLNTTLVDWASIIGWVLHHPHGAVEDMTRTIDEGVVDSLPASFAIARASDEDEIPKKTLAQAVRLLYPQGWAASAFDHAYEVHQAEALSVDPAGIIAADLDQSESEYGPRRELLRFWDTRAASRILTTEAVETLREAVRDEFIHLSTRRVARLGEFGTGADIDEPDFYRGVATASTAFVNDMFTQVARVEGKQEVHRSVVWLPAVADAREQEDTVLHAVGMQSVAVRADVSQRLAPTDLSMFAAAPAAAPAVAPQSPVASQRPTTSDDTTTGWA